MKKACFFMCMFVGLLLMSGCSKDEDGQQTTKNEVVYDGKSFNIIAARMEDISSQGEVTSIPIDLYLNEDGSSYLSVEVESSDLGKSVDLSKVGNMYWIVYNNDSTHYSWYKIDGESSADNLGTGSFARVTRMSNGSYSIDVAVSFTRSATSHQLTAHYEGTVMNNWANK